MAPVIAPAPWAREHKPFRLPSVLMRSGTSRGLFLHRHHLPASESEWAPLLISAMGSQNGDDRQLEGVGGATSTTSKVVVVSKSDKLGIDVEYTFIQVAVGQEKTDMSGNCGNMASGVAAFALDEGLVHAEPGQTELAVRIFNRNTQSLLVETIQVGTDGRFLEDGDYRISGVKGSGSRVMVKFINPGGSMTGETFPTGLRQEFFTVSSANVTDPFSVRATLMDVSNPFIFVDSATLPPVYHTAGPDAHTSLEIIESIRRQGAVQFGLAKDTESAGLRRGTPKIAILSPAYHSTKNVAHAITGPYTADIRVLAYSMGKVHPSFQLTGAVCLGAALCLRGTVAADLWKKGSPITPSDSPEESDEEYQLGYGLNTAHTSKKIVIAHKSGKLDVEVDLSEDDDIQGVTVYRTAKRLFEGTVLVRV